jgi:hypothetical protein
MTNDQTQPLPDFGEPMPRDELLSFGELTQSEVDSAIDWWDENATPPFVGILE